MKKKILIILFLSLLIAIFNGPVLVSAEDETSEHFTSTQLAWEIDSDTIGDTSDDTSWGWGYDPTTGEYNYGGTNSSGDGSSGDNNGNTETGDVGSFTKVPVPSLRDYGPGSWEAIGSNIINLLATVAGTALVIMLLVGGVMFIASAGNEEQAGKAKTVLTNAIIGIIIVIAAWGIITFVVDLVK